MTRIDFNTGRGYTPYGQEITAVKIGNDVLMVDHSRMITYNIPDCPLQVTVIMKRYDQNRTEGLESSELYRMSSKIQAEHGSIVFESIPC